MVLTPEQELEREEGIWDCPLFKDEIAEGLCYEVTVSRQGFFASGMMDIWGSELDKTKEEINQICDQCAKYRYLFG